MRRLAPLIVGGLLTGTLALGGCGGERSAPAAPADKAAAGAPAEPWDTIPPERLYGAGPVENLRVTPVELDLAGIPAGWDGMRLAVLSDFQLGLWEGNAEVARAAVQRAVRANPDLVVLLGDYLAEGVDTTTLASVLSPLRGRAALAVLGDRDVRSDSVAAAVTRTLSGQGIRVLRGSSARIGRGGDTAMISGVDPDLLEMPWGDKQWVLSQAGAEGRRGLLLTHVPQLVLAAPRGRFPGVLAGNTYCGSVEVPGTPRLSWLNEAAMPGTAAPGLDRLYRLGNSVMFVTCGLGYGFVPVRFGAPPEVALVTLRRVAGSQPPAQDSASMDTLIQRFQRSDTAGGDTTR